MQRALALLLLVLALGSTACHRTAEVAGAVVVTAAALALEAELYHHSHHLDCGCAVYCEVDHGRHHYRHHHH